MACPLLPPMTPAAYANVYFDPGTYAAHLETPTGDLDLSNKSNGVHVCITIDSANHAVVKFYKQRHWGYAVRYSDVVGGQKLNIYNRIYNHQFIHGSISSDGVSIRFTYNNDRTGGGSVCSPGFAHSSIGFVIVDPSGKVHFTDPIIDNGSNLSMMGGPCGFHHGHHHH